MLREASTSGLGRIYVDQERCDETHDLFTRGIEIEQRERLGENNPHTLKYMNALAALCTKQKRYTEAEKLFKEASEARKDKLGDDHLDTLESKNDLAIFLSLITPCCWARSMTDASGMNAKGASTFAVTCRSRIRVHSPKTEHHEGGGARMVPLFSELVPYLREVFEEAEPGSEYVVTRYRSMNCSLRTQLQRIYPQGRSQDLAEAVSEPAQHARNRTGRALA